MGGGVGGQNQYIVVHFWSIVSRKSKLTEAGRTCQKKKKKKKNRMGDDALTHQIIDNHGSGYLGMARCFNVHRQLPVSKETVISQHRNIFG